MTELLERRDLLAALEAARRAGGRLVFVGGEAGVGKTALVRTFATETPGTVLLGACENLATPTPLGAVADVADALGGALAAVMASGGEPRAVARALLGELDGRTLLVLEDVHWADQATLDVLRVLGRRIDAGEALVLATYRDDEVEGGHPLGVVLGELASAPGVSRIAVPRLSPAAVLELAEPSGADGEAIYRLTKGNAFYVTEILAAAGGALPPTVRDAVLARAAALEPAARRLLDLVAVVPARAELWLLAAIAGHELGELDVCLESGMVREDGDGVMFRHELARLAVESAVPAGRRRALHAAILAALAAPPAGPPDLSRLAHHAEEAGDTTAVVAHAPAAARLAARAGAHREAAGQYARALRHAQTVPDTERVELLSEFADEAYVTGRYDDSVAARREAIELLHILGDPLREGSALSQLTIPLTRAGWNAEAENASLAAITLLESLPPSRELGYAYAAQAYARMLSRDNADGVRWGEQAVALAEQFDDRETLAFGLNMVGTCHMMGGAIERGIEILLESLTVARENGSEVWISSALGNLGSGLGEMYELERSERYLQEQIAYVEEHDGWPLYSRSWLSLVDVYRGRWDEGVAQARAVLAERSDPLSRISALIALGRVRARRGDPGVAELLDEALALSLSGGHLQRLAHVHAARAEAAWLVSDVSRTLEEAEAIYPLAVEKRHPWFAGELAYWQWKAGGGGVWPEWLAEPYRLQLEGSPGLAAQAWSARGCPYEAARSLAESGGEPELLEALAELARLGAGPAAAMLRTVLRASGAAVPRGPRSTTRVNPGGLTAREVDVVRLLADGRRNADIAAELVVSVRTIDHHVAAILRKLEVRSRGEAVVAARELGLLDEAS